MDKVSLRLVAGCSRNAKRFSLLLVSLSWFGKVLAFWVCEVLQRDLRVIFWSKQLSNKLWILGITIFMLTMYMVRLVRKKYKSIRSSLSALKFVQVRIAVFSMSVVEPVVLKLKTYLVILSLGASLSLQPFRWASLQFATTYKYPNRLSMKIPLGRQNYRKCHSSWYPWTFLV